MHMLHKLKAPNLDLKNLLYTVCEYRPYRRGGIRLDHQQLGTKVICHNYGHGGAGISLAYGSALESANKAALFRESHTRSNEVAVLGSGIIGLSTVVELAKQGFKPVVYTDHIPKYDDKPHQFTASQVATGKWSPGGYDLEANPEMHKKLSKVSYQFYRECIKTNRYRSLSFCKMYDAKSTVEQLRALIPESIINDYKNVQVQFTSGRTDKFVEFTTISIDTRQFLDELLTEAKKWGVQFRQKKFQSLQDVGHLTENNVVNCLGLGAKKVFNDENMKGKKGHLLCFNNTENIDYMMCGMVGKERVTLFPAGKELVIGISYLRDDNHIDKEVYDTIYKNACTYFEGTKPSL